MPFINYIRTTECHAIHSNMSSNKQILFILSNTRSFPNADIITGTNIYEVSRMYSQFKKSGFKNIRFASPLGGAAPIDPRSLDFALRDDETKMIIEKEMLVTRLQETTSLKEYMEHPKSGKGYEPPHLKENIDAVVVPGGRALLFDLALSYWSSEIIYLVWKKGGIVATIGHGAAALATVMCEGKHFVTNKKLTCIPAEEERIDGLPVPFYTENLLGRMGAKFSKSSEPNSPFVVEDDRLVTGENYFSSEELVKKVVNLMK